MIILTGKIKSFILKFMLVKKLTFAPVFLIIFSITSYKIAGIFNNYQILFSLDFASFASIITISTLFLLSGLSFVLFATFANDWKLILPIVAIALFLPVIFIPQPLNFIIGIGFLAAFVITNLGLENKLKFYLTFEPSTLLIPIIKNLTTFLILVTAFGFYLSSSAEIKNTGFAVPDSLIDTVIQSIPVPNIEDKVKTGNPSTQFLSGLPKLNKEQIELLKQNPQALEQFGLDPKILDSLDQESPGQTSSNPITSLQSPVKNLVKSQLDQTLKPYLSFIPAFLAVTLFFTLNWIVSILSLTLSPVLWVVFEILTKTGFATFTTEMREVKKLVA